MSDSPPPGYYPAQGDPPNTTRYWDGAAWVGGPIPTDPPSPQHTSVGPPGAPGQAQRYPEDSQAVVALIMALLGLTMCQILCPLAWYFGQRELTAIDEGRRDPSKRDWALASKIIGIAGTVLLVIGLLFLLLFVVGLVAAGSSS